MLDFIKSMISAIKTWVKGEIVISAADWNESDPGKTNYIKNRTHYDTREEHEVRITFDGNLEGMEYISIPGINGLYYVKVSEFAPTTEELVGGKVALRIGDETRHDEILEIVTVEPGVRTYGEMVGAMFLDAPFTKMGITMSAGTWFMLVDENDTLGHITELSYTIASGELKKLDAKYLPEAEPSLTIEIAGPNATIVSGSWEVTRQEIESNKIPNIVIFENRQEGDNTIKRLFPPTLVTGMLENQYNSYFIGIRFDYFPYNNSKAEGWLLIFYDGVFNEMKPAD